MRSFCSYYGERPILANLEIDMGFGRGPAERALAFHDGDVEVAANALVDDPIAFEDTSPEEAAPPEQPVSGSGEAANPFTFEDTPPEEEPAPASQTPEAEYDDNASL